MTFEELLVEHGIKLNEQQRKAVLTVEGPVLLLAVPGSGKTTVLVTRLGYMIYGRGIRPEEILTLTYTISATKDMSARFRTLFGDEMADRLEFRTINGICARIIYQYSKAVGKKPFELITDEKNVLRILGDIYRQVEGGFATESDLRSITTTITYIKNMMLSAKDIQKLEENSEYKISEIYKEYCNTLRAQGLMDYDDQMIYAYNILRKSPEMLEQIQKQYPYICVDEAQDTSRIQHAIIALLARRTENLFMVGDEDQSIYGFRAAYPEALLQFEENHPGAQILVMEENFRSNARIVKAADRFIQQNTFRHKKHMRATREAASDVQVIEVATRATQYSHLAKVASDCNEQTAVLYRDNESALPLIDRLERQGIPYTIRSAELSFFSHRIVTDIRNVIHFAYHPQDTEAFLQIYYKIGTYLNKQTAIKACEYSTREGIPVLEAAIRFCHLPGGTEKSCKAMITHLANLKNERADIAVNRIVSFMGYGEYLERMNMKDKKVFILRAIGRQQENPQALLERLDELEAIIREKKTDRNCKFFLSTIHSSKGLEYDRVYLLDISDGIFPETLAEDRAQYEEERRLFYVGATRAKEELAIFKFPGKATFLTELTGWEPEKKAPGKKEIINPKSMLNSFLTKKSISEKELKEYRSRLSEGLRVLHKSYGQGTIIKVDEQTAWIRFGDEEKKFAVRMLAEGKLVKLLGDTHD